MHDALDRDFGVPRSPDRIDPWETNCSPASLSILDGALAETLCGIEVLARSPMLAAALRATNFIWAMGTDGRIRLAIKEFANLNSAFPYDGYPRRRSCYHPSEEKKLGHPTLLDGADARIAGELALDDPEGTGLLRWVLNRVRGGTAER